MKISSRSILVALCVLVTVLPVAAQVGTNEKVLNPNRAGTEELMALPHMTQELAAGIMGNRPFLGQAKLDEYLGDKLNDEQRAELYAMLFVPINLNKASRDEILLVPGVGETAEEHRQP